MTVFGWGRQSLLRKEGYNMHDTEAFWMSTLSCGVTNSGLNWYCVFTYNPTQQRPEESRLNV